MPSLIGDLLVLLDFSTPDASHGRLEYYDFAWTLTWVQKDSPLAKRSCLNPYTRYFFVSVSCPPPSLFAGSVDGPVPSLIYGIL